MVAAVVSTVVILELYAMSLDPAIFSPMQAWTPLKKEDWNQDAARHLLHRIGFSATPDRVEQTFKQGLPKTLDDAFGSVRPFTPPESLAAYTEKRNELITAQRTGAPASQPDLSARRGSQGAAGAVIPPQRQLAMEINQLQQEAFHEFVQAWLAFAVKPENSPQENLTMFLANVLVVAQSKVKDPDRIHNHIDLLRTSFQQPYPQIIKVVTYSPAMIQYLDLNTSAVGVPNENYAREVMELFTLGEGHYTENDIKEAARALTGIVVNNEQGTFVRRRWDAGSKTIFGRSGKFGASDVVDLIFEQPAASTHLPKRFLAYFLSPDPLPAPYLTELGNQWASSDFRVDQLARTVFSSQLFYRPEFRGAMVKTPIQYYLGLCQDLNLDVSPFENQIYQNLRSMGQEPFNPPNVRGWLGGENWINSSTFAARRQLVQQMFNPINEHSLTADLQAKLDGARQAGQGAITMDNTRLQNLADKSDEEIATQLLNYFFVGEATDAYHRDILDYMQNDQGARIELVRDVAIALFQSPVYHLC
jgi:uncharacterized protein (DUF1800 family)